MTLAQDFYLYFFAHFFSTGVLIRSRNSDLHINSNYRQKLTLRLHFRGMHTPKKSHFRHMRIQEKQFLFLVITPLFYSKIHMLMATEQLSIRINLYFWRVKISTTTKNTVKFKFPV